MKKRFLTALLSVAMVGALASGCGSNTSGKTDTEGKGTTVSASEEKNSEAETKKAAASSGQVTVTVMDGYAPEDPHGQYIYQYAEEFMKENPDIKVEIQAIASGDIYTKLAHFCDAYQVRTAWHGPNDLSPIGMAAQMHLDLNSHNFGIQEFSGFSEEEMAVFPGCPAVEKGYAYIDDRPGIGVGFDEKEAANYPPVEMAHSWLFARLPDGTAVRP